MIRQVGQHLISKSAIFVSNHQFIIVVDGDGRYPFHCILSRNSVRMFVIDFIWMIDEFFHDLWNYIRPELMIS